MAESPWPNLRMLGRVRMVWPSSSGLAESSWPSPNELPNHPGRVRLAGRIRVVWPKHPGRVNFGRLRVNFGRVNLAESEWHGRMNLVESEWHSLDHFDRVRLRWPSDLDRLREYFGRVNFGRLREYFGRATLVDFDNTWSSPLG